MKKETKIYFVIYKITNLKNGMIYIGQHRTTNIDDGYMGSGSVLERIYAEYRLKGLCIKDYFKRDILFIFDNFNDMNKKEAEIVSKEFIARPDTYNIYLGGQGHNTYYGLEIEYQGKKFTAKELALKLGMKRHSLLERIRQGWTIDEIINTPIQNKNEKFNINGKNLTLHQIANEYGISYELLRHRVHDKHMNIDDALSLKIKPHIKKYEFNGKYKTLKEWSKLYNINYKLVANRVQCQKWPLLRALTEPVHNNRKRK